MFANIYYRVTQTNMCACVQAIFSTVIPGDAMKGSMGGMIKFPSWLGKNSTTNKNERILAELRNHLRLQ